MCYDITIAVFLSQWRFFILNTALKTKGCICNSTILAICFNLISPLSNYTLSVYLLSQGYGWTALLSLFFISLHPEVSSKIRWHFFHYLTFKKKILVQSRFEAVQQELYTLRSGLKENQLHGRNMIFDTDPLCAN